MASRGVTSHEVVPFVGRSMELRLLQTWATEAACGDPRLVVVSGEAGSGKTRLIEVLLAGLGPTPGLAGGAMIVSAACYDELGVPGRPLAQLLDALNGPGYRGVNPTQT